MTEATLGHPADLAEEGVTYGGFADVAKHLNALHPERPKPISRQLVHRWFKCRASNQMPGQEPIEVEGGKTKSLFNLQAVEQWYSNPDRRKRTPKRDANPPIETIPLFMIDPQGRMIA